MLDSLAMIAEGFFDHFSSTHADGASSAASSSQGSTGPAISIAKRGSKDRSRASNGGGDGKSRPNGKGKGRAVDNDGSGSSTSGGSGSSAQAGTALVGRRPMSPARSYASRPSFSSNCLFTKFETDLRGLQLRYRLPGCRPSYRSPRWRTSRR